MKSREKCKITKTCLKRLPENICKLLCCQFFSLLCSLLASHSAVLQTADARVLDESSLTDADLEADGQGSDAADSDANSNDITVRLSHPR